jgi:3,4-dihydroxy 2-butanone 4-phosphate synthase/GTP cyclohydrolase II
MKSVQNTATRYAEAMLPTQFGTFRCIVYHLGDGLEHVALIKNDVENKSSVLVRIHSECLTGEVFSSLKCDCQNQLYQAMALINEENLGALLYLRQEGRGIGLGNKIKAYQLQQQGIDTVDANLMLGFPQDGRDFHCAIRILRDLNLASIKLLTNNPQKMESLINAGIHVVERVPLVVNVSELASNYMATKAERLGHILTKKIAFHEDLDLLALNEIY